MTSYYSDAFNQLMSRWEELSSSILTLSNRDYLLRNNIARPTAEEYPLRRHNLLLHNFSLIRSAAVLVAESKQPQQGAAADNKENRGESPRAHNRRGLKVRFEAILSLLYSVKLNLQ